MEIQCLKNTFNYDQCNSANNKYYSDIIQSTNFHHTSKHVSPNNVKLNKKIYNEIENIKKSCNRGKNITSNILKNKNTNFKSSISNTFNKNNKIINYNSNIQNETFFNNISYNSKINYNKHAGFNLFSSKNFVREKQPEDIDIRVFGKELDAIEKFSQEMSGGKSNK